MFKKIENSKLKLAGDLLNSMLEGLARARSIRFGQSRRLTVPCLYSRSSHIVKPIVRGDGLARDSGFLNRVRDGYWLDGRFIHMQTLGALQETSANPTKLGDAGSAYCEIMGLSENGVPRTAAARLVKTWRRNLE